MPSVAPYGTWSSPITTDLLVSHAVGLADPLVEGDDLYWVEQRPEEQGRRVIVRRDAMGSVSDLLPAGWSTRTRVNEYGGASFALHRGTCYFASALDQRMWRLVPGDEPVAITPEPPRSAGFRYGGPSVTPDGKWVVCVRERHLLGEPVNDLVAVATDGSGERVLTAGADFYGTPALSPGGDRLAWCQWNHPNMPWDSSELHEAPFDDGVLGAQRLVAGGPGESLTEPRYGNDGRLMFVSDRTGWWNLYADTGTGAGAALVEMEAEFGGPDWVLGNRHFGVSPGGTVVAAWTAQGHGHLGVLEPGATSFREFSTPWSSFEAVTMAGEKTVVVIAGSPTQSPALIEVDIESGRFEVVRESRPAAVDPAYLSLPEPFEFETFDGERAHALVYPPTNQDFVADAGERAPLIVSAHGGPTSSASSDLDYQIQFWTSRGFAVADVDYRGSSGYGRAYRRALCGQWGVIDRADCEAAALVLAAGGRADPTRLLIHGRSAGGYTVLCALTFGRVFAAGASIYGIADLVALANDTHKFESRYFDGLVGPLPEAAATYAERSPLAHADRLDSPLIVLQGLDDPVVPPNQAEMIVGALRARGVPVAYVPFDGESHGFRRAETIKRAAEAELSFYGQVLGFEPDGVREPVLVDNLE
ncbi:MAG: peptidase [Acidimicrobiaceae bacterium]|nr:peptidase [Acidimicrobiaceae bacterium]